MIRFFSRATLFVCACAFSYTAHAQTQVKFSENPSDFVSGLNDFMTASKRPDMEEAFSVFRGRQRAGIFSENDMRRIIAVANRMSELRLSAYPYFKNYINAVSAVRIKADTSLFSRWHTTIEKTLADAQPGKTKPIGTYLEFSADFLERSAFKSGSGGSVTWRISGGKYDFEYADMEPMLRCEGINLIGMRKTDSISINGTSGVYRPLENRWEGNGGKVSWKGSGLDSSVYAIMTRYNVDANKPLFQCDSVQLSYPLYFPKGEIAGKFEDYIEVDKEDNRRYPRFESFDKTLKINKIGEGIEYVGGFKLWGGAIYGYGLENEPARLTIYNPKRERIFYGVAPLFIINREKSIVAEGVDAKLFMLEDSLFHPAVGFRLDIPKQVIHLARGSKGSERNPFYSSFYNMNLDADRISWHIMRDSLEIGASAGVTKGGEQTVTFESSNHYSPDAMVKIQRSAHVHPVSSLFSLYESTGSVLVSDDAFARTLNPQFDYSSIQTLLAEMVAEGYINYYFNRHEIEIRDKLIHYARASQGKTDYDNIKIKSTSNKSNARLNLKSKETTIFEVDNIELSHERRVAIVPNDKALVLQKNRDMRLGGRLYAGYALFEGKDMHFNYERFHVAFDSVRHLDFYLPMEPMDPATKRYKAVAMNSTVEYVSGVLLIDAPNNKSGAENLKMFPSMESKEPSFVYYERKEIQNGAYKRDSFFFKLTPFSFGPLDDYRPADLKFKGELFSSEMFPNFKETIVVREHDKSFGFIHKTPPKGYPTYSKKGTFTGELDLSNKGMLGKGLVEYLTADIESEDLIFRPRQMTGTAKKFSMEEDRVNAVKVPQAKGQDVKVNWLPFRDSMYVESKGKAFELFLKPGYTHKGTLVLTPTGLKGRGVFEWAEGRLKSKLITYGPFQAGADTADLEIKSLTGNALALDAKNVDGELDFDAMRGQFKANSEKAATTLPLDKYRTSMNEFNWDMNEKTITFKSDPNKPGVFISTDPEQDTLSFEGKTAFYDMNTNLLSVGGVEVIKSADAYVWPDSGQVEILSTGKMKAFENARIVADTTSKYHTINRASVEIQGKKAYKAKGYYEYNLPGFDQEVFFDNIVGERYGGGLASKRNVRTTASGTIAEGDTFRMDLKTFFEGDILLKSNQQNLRFEGHAKLDAPKLPGADWFTVYTEVDKKNPITRIQKAKNKLDDPLFTGIFLSKETGECYPRVLQPAMARVDRPIINCQDLFKYDVKTDKFIFGDSAKIVGNSARGARMTFDNKTSAVLAEGPLSIGSGLQFMKVKAAGRVKTDYNITDSTTYQVTCEMMSGMEITIPKPIYEVMLNDVKAASFDAPTVIYTSQQPFYQLALPEFVSDPEKDAEISANLKNNVLALPKADDKYAFLIGRHNVMWNAEYQSFLGTDDKIPFISINGEPINKMLSAYIEYKMPGNEDDRFYIYFKAAPDLWYFFGYQAGVLNVVSSSTRFNDVVLGLKAKDTLIKMPNGETYEIVPANPNVAAAFVSRVQEGRQKQ